VRSMVTTPAIGVKQSIGNHYFVDKGRDALTGNAVILQRLRHRSSGVLTPLEGVITPTPQRCAFPRLFAAILETSS
jgi:hypothetical protein